MRNFRYYFTISGLATSLILGLAPSLWDSISYFLFAHEEEELCSLGKIDHGKNTSASSCLTYFFISLPGHMNLATGLHRLISWSAGKCYTNQSPNKACSWIARAVRGAMNLLSFAALISMAMLSIIFVPQYFYYAAVLSTLMILGVKVLALIVHGPEVKKLATRVTSAESQYESSLQLLLVITICLKNETLPGPTSVSSILSSILVIGKSGAESYLTFGQENLLQKCGQGWKGLLNKIKLLAKYSPVFIVTAIFRLSALEIVFAWNVQLGVFILLPLAIGVPTILLLFMKLCKLKDMTVVEILEVVIAEMTTHSLWGSRGREGSRNLQLFMTIYMTSIHTVCLLIAIFDLFNNGKTSNTMLNLDEIRTPAAVSCIVVGWLSRVVLSCLFYLNLSN